MSLQMITTAQQQNPALLGTANILQYLCSLERNLTLMWGYQSSSDNCDTKISNKQSIYESKSVF